jgi:hypothetical protein
VALFNYIVALPKFTDTNLDLFFKRNPEASDVKVFFLFLVESMFDLLKKAVPQAKAADDKVNNFSF